MSKQFIPKIITPIPGNYRLMQQGDLEAVYEIDKTIYPYPWTLGIFKDCVEGGQLCMVNIVDEQVAAYGIVGMIADEAHLLNLSVRQDLQGQGYGREMLVFLLDLIVHNRATRAILEVRVSNQVALNLYTSLGFEEIGMRKDYYPADNGRENAIVLALSLSPSTDI